MLRQCIFIIVISLFCYPEVKAQQSSQTDSIQSSAQKDTAQVNIIQDSRIKDLLDKQIAINKKEKGKFQGYRIQIHFGSSSGDANKIKSQFLLKYPDINAYVLYQQPFFKVRVGDFRTKLEAKKFLVQMNQDFPGSFIVTDKINLPKL